MRVITRKLLCFLPHPADGWVEEKVEKTGKEEGDEGNCQRVDEENVALRTYIALLNASPVDVPVEEEFEKAEKKEGDEGHHKKVGKEDIVPHTGGNVQCLTL